MFKLEPQWLISAARFNDETSKTGWSYIYCTEMGCWVLDRKFSSADGGILLNGPYVMVAPDLVAGVSRVNASRSFGSVNSTMRGVGDLHECSR